MKPSNNEPRPEDSPLGSPESRAAARLLAGKRKAALIPVMCVQISGVGALENSENIRQCQDGDREPLICVELDPERIGNTPMNWMTRQELEAKQREYEECEKRCTIERDATRPSVKEVCAPAAFDEKKPGPTSPTADAAPQEPEPEPEPERAPLVEARRRPLVRHRPRRFSYPPSAYGL